MPASQPARKHNAAGKVSTTPQEIAARVHAFVTNCRQPVLMEQGEAPLPLAQDRFVLTVQASGCVLEAWGNSNNLVRRITAVTSETSTHLELRMRSFGRGEIAASIIDAVNTSPRFERQAEQSRFREVFRRMLQRDFPAWRLERLSSAADLEHSISPLYARALLAQGQEAWAVIAASADLAGPLCDRILTFGLIWLDWLRQRERRRIVRGLRILVPRGHAAATAHRLVFLDDSVARFELFEFDQHRNLHPIDPLDYGNLQTALPVCLPLSEPEEPIATWIREMVAIPGVEDLPCTDGLHLLRVRGLTIARAGRGIVEAGLDEPRFIPHDRLGEVTRFARQLSRLRSTAARDTQNPLYRSHPERWLEAEVRRQPSIIGPDLVPEPIYQQIPAIAGAERGTADLLACDQQGRLTVLELKASEDIELPLQGLDYWIRVQWLLARGDFRRSGYFPGRELAAISPRLALVAPALDFHPSTEIVLRYFSPRVDVERVGVGAEWRKELRVVFRKKGAERLA